MKAILVDNPTGGLYIGDVPDPQPGDHELVVSVRATALNRADLLQRRGDYPPPPGASPIIGLEMSGIVERIGSLVQGWNVGDRVCALLPGGGYAQKVTIPAQMAMRIPDHYTFEQAAAIPEVFLTAYLNLFQLGQLQRGDFVLIHAAASGVGTAAIQLAREAGAIAIATAGSDNKLSICRQLGATHTINYKETDFAAKVLEVTDGNGASLILDPVGASYWEQNFRCIRPDGRWIVIGGLGGWKVNELSLGAMMSKRIQLVFSTLRSRSTADKIALTEQFLAFAADKFHTGKLRPIIDCAFNWSDVEIAHEHMMENLNIGKIILQVT